MLILKQKEFSSRESNYQALICLISAKSFVPVLICLFLENTTLYLENKPNI